MPGRAHTIVRLTAHNVVELSRHIILQPGTYEGHRRHGSAAHYDVILRREEAVDLGIFMARGEGPLVLDVTDHVSAGLLVAA